MLYNDTDDSVSVTQTSQLMLYREIIAVCSEIHTKHINTVCGGQNVELLNVKLAVCIVTSGLKGQYHPVFRRYMTQFLSPPLNKLEIKKKQERHLNASSANICSTLGAPVASPNILRIIQYT